MKGPEATRRFAALLPKLAPEAQVGLLGALAERGDAAARPAVLDLLNHSQGEVRGAAIRALGALGDEDDVPRLTKLLGEADSREGCCRRHHPAAWRGHQRGLVRRDENRHAGPARQAAELLVARHAIDAVPTLLDAAKDADAGVRVAALEALGQLAGPEVVAKLAHLILDAKDAAAREEAERSLALIARRNPKDARPRAAAAVEASWPA